MHADARNNLGMTLRDLERNTDAIVQFQRALRLQPEMAAAHLNLALSFSVAGRNAEAAIHLREARRLNPKIPDLRLD
jgi:tetratricopeptide (TPR) repeat protein